MNPIPETLIEVREHNEASYKPLIDYQSWRVALMNYTAELTSEKIKQMQKHVETDEVFVLLAGKCILFLGEGEKRISKIHAVDMQPYKLYNIKRGVWHSHTFSIDARVLIVENSDTTDKNSPFTDLSVAQRRQIISDTKTLWS